MFCSNCGMESSFLEQKYCSKCGMNLSKSPTPVLPGQMYSHPQALTTPSNDQHNGRKNLFKYLPALLVIFLALFLADQSLRNWELKAFIDQVQSSESKMLLVNDRHNEVEAKYWKGSRWTNFYAVEHEYASIAEEFGPEIHASRTKIGRIFIFPWHTSISKARTDYMTHQLAWEQSLNFELKTTDELLWDEELNGEISNTWKVVQETLPQSVPLIDLFNNKDRIKKLVSD